jgi:hypothetical protein
MLHSIKNENANSKSGHQIDKVGIPVEVLINCVIKQSHLQKVSFICHSERVSIFLPNPEAC